MNIRGAVRALPLSPATRQRLKWHLANSRFGPLVLRWLTVVRAEPAAVPPDAPCLDKDAVRAGAESELSAFLSSGQRLQLGPVTGTPLVSVVVVLYNQAGLSLLCLRALAASRGVTFETLIVDNASSDRVPQLLDRLDGVTVMPQAGNLGFLRAVNLAAAKATGQYLLLLNNDAVIEPDTLAHAVARLAREPDAGAVGGPILLWDGRLQEAGSIIWRDGSCRGYGRGDSPAAPAYGFVRDVDYCSAALLLVRRAQFEQLGGFEEAYAPAYYEDSDFCVRLWKAGYRTVYDPRVRVQHLEFASNPGSGRAIELQTRNRARFVERHAEFLAARPLPAAATVLTARQRLRPGAKRVLVIDDRVPLPWLGQGYPRAASLVEQIVAGGDFVTHYPLQFPHERAADVARALPESVEVMLNLGLAGLADFLVARAGYFDVAIISRPHNMEVVRAVMRQRPAVLRGVRIVYDAEALFALRDIAKAAMLGRPVRDDEQHRRIAAEMALARGAQVIVTVSAVEARHYREAGHANVQVLGHSFAARPCAAPFAARRGFLFVGALPADDTPNADSMFWFVREVWPRIVDVLGDDAGLDIVGVCEAPGVRALAGPAVRVHGKVEDLGRFYAAARVFIVPTRYAGGIPYKAHEAAAHGLPMVVSPLIARQLDWFERVPVGAGAAGFADACLRLHREPAEWAAVRRRVLAAVHRDCAPIAFQHTVQAILGRTTHEGEG